MMLHASMPTVQTKSKNRWSSRGVFGSKTANKVQVTENINEPAGLLHHDHLDISNDLGPGLSARKITVVDKLRRSGSVMLSIVGIRAPSCKSPRVMLWR